MCNVNDLRVRVCVTNVFVSMLLSKQSSAELRIVCEQKLDWHGNLCYAEVHDRICAWRCHWTPRAAVAAATDARLAQWGLGNESKQCDIIMSTAYTLAYGCCSLC